MSAIGALASAIGFSLPWISDLVDPHAQQIRKLQNDEQQHAQRATQCETLGSHAQAQVERDLERECHNGAITLLMGLARAKAQECRSHGWTQAAERHEREVQQLEAQLWAPIPSSSFAPPPSNSQPSGGAPPSYEDATRQ